MLDPKMLDLTIHKTAGFGQASACTLVKFIRFPTIVNTVGMNVSFLACKYKIYKDILVLKGQHMLLLLCFINISIIEVII